MSLLSYRYKKDVHGRPFSLKCRGNLNWTHKKLIYKVNSRFVFLLEYLLEYLHQRLIRIRLAEVMLLSNWRITWRRLLCLEGMSVPPVRIALRLAQGECISSLRAFA